MMRKILFIILIILMVSAILLVSPAGASQPAPISGTYMYDVMSKFDVPYTEVAYRTDRINLTDQETTGSVYMAASADGFLRPAFWVHDGDSFNFTFTTAGGKTYSGWISKWQTSEISSWCIFNFNGYTKGFVGSRWVLPVVQMTDEFTFGRWVYNYTGVDQQWAFGTLISNSNTAAAILTPLLNANDSITSAYVKVNSGKPWVRIDEYRKSSIILNSNGQKEVNGVPTDEGGKWDLLQVLDAIYSLFQMMSNLFNGMLIAFSFLLALFLFFCDPIHLMLTFLLIEAVGAAFASSVARDIPEEFMIFANFEIVLFSVFLTLGNGFLQFLYFMLDVLMKLPDIIAKAAEVISNILGRIGQIATTVVTFILLVPK